MFYFEFSCPEDGLKILEAYIRDKFHGHSLEPTRMWTLLENRFYPFLFGFNSSKSLQYYNL